MKVVIIEDEKAAVRNLRVLINETSCAGTCFYGYSPGRRFGI